MKTKILLMLLAMSTTFSNYAQNAGNTLYFDGNNDYCSSTLPTVFNNIGTNDFTVECWVSPKLSSATRRVFFAQKDASNFCTILLNSSDIPYFYVLKNGTNYSANTQIQLSASAWSHLAFSWDASTNTISSYINGNLVAAVSGGGSSVGNDNVMTIGARTDGQQLFDGSIDELRIWDDIRTPCEILAGMNSTFTTAQPNLIASYNFNQGVADSVNTGITTLNELNNNYNGTLNNFALTGSASNWVASSAPIYLTDNNGVTYYANDVIEACETYTWIDGNTYTANNNTASFTYTSAGGCDSTILLNLTIKRSTTATDAIVACETYIWIDGNTYTASNNTATHTLTNAVGCDSLVTLDLTINQPTSGIDTVVACVTYTWIDGNTYTANNDTATFNIVAGAANGCDSLVTLNLTINSLPDITTATANNTITANNTSAAYQWLDCNNNYAELFGETGQSFTASATGDYAVELTENGCVDTALCVNITIVGIVENNFGSRITLYPNPTTGQSTVLLNAEYDDVSVVVRDVLGKEALRKNFNSANQLNFTIQGETGIYFVEIKSNEKRAVMRLMKE